MFPPIDPHTKTPRPRSDIFNEASFLTSKKCRTSTPSLKPPKPPTKHVQRYMRKQNKGQQTGRLNAEFKNITKIGSGNFAIVYKAQSRKDGVYYAIKKTSEKYTSEADKLRKLQEVENLKLIPPHPNIIRFYDYWFENRHLHIQIELCETSLNQLVERSPDNKLSENQVWNLFVDLLLGIKHLHDKDLLHLDVKPDNILISFDGGLKLGDFGLLCDLSKHNNSLPTQGECLNDYSLEKSEESDTIEGDSKYLALETMQGKFTKAADIFSIGITIFEIATGMELPNNGTIYHMLRHNEIEDLYFKGLSRDLIKLIRLMMEENYTKRPSVEELLQMDKVKQHVRTRQLKTKLYSSYSKGKQFFLSLAFIMFTFLWTAFRKVLHINDKKEAEPSPSVGSDNNDSDEFNASTNFDTLNNGYDSEELFHTSEIRPKNLLGIFDQLSDED